jgi:hypothetical protein
VLNVELLGHERHVICDVAGSRWTIRDAAHGFDVGVGTPITLGVDAAAVHVFNATTMERID